MLFKNLFTQLVHFPSFRAPFSVIGLCSITIFKDLERSERAKNKRNFTDISIERIVYGFDKMLAPNTESWLRNNRLCVTKTPNRNHHYGYFIIAIFQWKSQSLFNERRKKTDRHQSHTHTHIIRINGVAIYFSHFSKISRIRSIRNDDFVVWLNLLLRVKWNSIECVKCSSNKQYQFQKTSFLRGI